MEPVTLRTDRLILHPPRLADAAAITAACQDPEIPRWTTVPTPYTREHADGFIELTEQAWADGSQAVWGIHAGDELVGVVGLHHIDEHPSGGAQPNSGTGLPRLLAARVSWSKRRAA